jgi:hypothetical protein
LPARPFAGASPAERFGSTFSGSVLKRMGAEGKVGNSLSSSKALIDPHSDNGKHKHEHVGKHEDQSVTPGKLA